MVICMERMVWLDCMVRKDGHMVMDVRYARDQDGDGSGPPSDILATAPRSTEPSSASSLQGLTPNNQPFLLTHIEKIDFSHISFNIDELN